MISRANDGAVTAAPPHGVPRSLPTLGDMAEDIKRRVQRFTRQLPVDEADSISEIRQVPDVVDTLPRSSDFVLTPQLNPLALDPERPPQPATVGERDNKQSSRFKTALKDSSTVLQNGLQAGVIPAAVPVNVVRLATDTLTALNPLTTMPKWTLGKILLSAHILKLIGEKFIEAMAYPEFDILMYIKITIYSTSKLSNRGTRLCQPQRCLSNRASIGVAKLFRHG